MKEKLCGPLATELFACATYSESASSSAQYCGLLAKTDSGFLHSSFENQESEINFCASEGFTLKSETSEFATC